MRGYPIDTWIGKEGDRRLPLIFKKNPAQLVKVIDTRPDGEHQGHIKNGQAYLVQKGDRQHAEGEDEGTEGNVLDNGLPFAQATGRHDNAGGGGNPAQSGDDNLAAENDQGDPGGEFAGGNEHDQGGGHQHLIGQGIHQLAQHRYFFVLAGEVTIDPVGSGGDTEHQPGNQGIGGGLLTEQKQHQAAGENEPAACDQVGEIEDFRTAIQLIVTICRTLTFLGREALPPLL